MHPLLTFKVKVRNERLRRTVQQFSLPLHVLVIAAYEDKLVGNDRKSLPYRFLTLIPVSGFC